MPPAPAPCPGRQQLLSHSERSEVRPEAAKYDTREVFLQLPHRTDVCVTRASTFWPPAAFWMSLAVPSRYPPVHIRQPHEGDLEWGTAGVGIAPSHLPRIQDLGRGTQTAHSTQRRGAAALSSHLFNSSFCIRVWCGCLMSVLTLGRRCLNGWL